MEEARRESGGNINLQLGVQSCSVKTRGGKVEEWFHGTTSEAILEVMLGAGKCAVDKV